MPSTDQISSLRRVARLLPMPIRQMPWRIGWMTRTSRFKQAPVRTTARLLRWTARELLSEELDFVTSRGQRMHTMSNNFVGLFTYVTGSYEPDLIAFIEERLTPGGTFVDVGANIGLYSIIASSVVGANGKVVAIEAHPYTYRFLAENFKTNALGNAVALNVAAGDSVGELSIQYEAGNSGSTHVATGESHDRQSKTARIEMRPLDAILAERDVRKVDYLKIDVEGFEPQVLRGAVEILAASPNLVVQTEIDTRHLSRYGYSPGDLAEPLVKNGYVPHRLENGALLPLAVEALEFGDIIWTRKS